MAVSYISNPSVTLDIVTRDQKVGLEDQRALIVGQIDPGVRAIGNIVFTTNPAANDTVTIGGTVVTFKASGATGSQVNIGASLALTIGALVTFLNASSDTNIVKCTYVGGDTTLYVTFKTTGTTGNAFTLAASVATVSGATLSGGLAASGTASGGSLVSDLPRTDAEINEFFGAHSHLAMVARHFRAINPYTNIDCLPLADNGTTRATATITLSGSATRDATLYFTAVSYEKHTYQIDVSAGDTPTEVLAALASAVALDRYQPFVYSNNGSRIGTFTAVNAGTHANDWLISYSGSCPGITITLGGWAGGATNPALTTLFDPVENIRYQTIVWPAAYSLTTLKAFINPRKNLTNDIKEGRAIVYRNEVLATAKTDANTMNCSEIVIMNNTPTNASTWVGPHLPEAPDVIAAKFAAARALRFESNVSISQLVVTNEPLDQFGGPDTASLPYFNTPLLGVGMPLAGTGYLESEQRDLQAHGVTVVGRNRTNNEIIMGVVVTTWLNDAAGNPDDTWSYLEWRDSHAIFREYIVNNVRKRFAQYRLTNGDVVPNRAMANAPMIKGYIMSLGADLGEMSILQKGQQARQYMQDNTTVTLDLAARKSTVAVKALMVSQLGIIEGSVKFSFDAAA